MNSKIRASLHHPLPPSPPFLTTLPHYPPSPPFLTTLPHHPPHHHPPPPPSLTTLPHHPPSQPFLTCTTLKVVSSTNVQCPCCPFSQLNSLWKQLYMWVSDLNCDSTVLKFSIFTAHTGLNKKTHVHGFINYGHSKKF